MPIAQNRRGRPANAAPVAKPETIVSDSEPAVESPIEPADAPPAPVEPEAPDVPVAPEAAAIEPVEPISVMLGSVSGVLQLAPVDEVLGVLADTFGARLETLRSTAYVLAQVDRIRDTEGRCAPIIFTGGSGEPAGLLAGIETLAGAIVAGIENVAVILVPADSAAIVQSWLVACHQRKQELFVAVPVDDGDSPA